MIDICVRDTEKIPDDNSYMEFITLTKEQWGKVKKLIEQLKGTGFDYDVIKAQDMSITIQVGCDGYNVAIDSSEHDRKIRENILNKALQNFHTIYAHYLYCKDDMCEKEQQDCGRCVYIHLKNELKRLMEEENKR